MKIAIDIRRFALGETTGPAPWLLGTLRALLTRGEPHTYVLFNTIYNYYLFPELPANVVRHTLSTQRYHEELQDRLALEGDYDLVLRTEIDGLLDRFPLERQIACLGEWEADPPPKTFASDRMREQRRALRKFQLRGGAVAVPNEAVHHALCSDGWTVKEHVFILPADAGADTLLSVFERVAEQAARQEPRVRVSTPPVVSIVTPSFNQGAFVRQTIDSVLQQDYPYIDYRVVDGGSTDDTVAILKSYGDRVQWLSEKDRGQTHAINKGLAQARGEILAYLNSDDLLAPGAVSRVVRHFHEQPECDLVYGRDAMIDAEGQYIKMYPTADYSFVRLFAGCCISQPAAFWRKRLADVVGPFDESLQLVMDYDYWLRADRAGGMLEHISDVLAHTRIHRDAKSSGAGQIEAYQKRFYREVFDIQVRHAGQVSMHYVHTLLYTSLLVPYPWLQRDKELLLHLYLKWFDYRCRLGQGRVRAALRLLREEGWRLPRLMLRPLDPRRWRRPSPRPRVMLEADLWLGPEVTCLHGGGPVRLSGVPACDSVLRVYRGETEVAAVPLQAKQPTEVCVEVPDPGPLRLTFSESDLLPDGRRAAFKLHGTTLFTERDAA